MEGSADAFGTPKITSSRSNNANESQDRNASNNADRVQSSPEFPANSQSGSGEVEETFLQGRAKVSSGGVSEIGSGGDNGGAVTSIGDTEAHRSESGIRGEPRSVESRSHRSSSSSSRKPDEVTSLNALDEGEEIKVDKSLPPSPTPSRSEKTREGSERREYDQQSGSGPPFPQPTRSLRFQQTLRSQSHQPSTLYYSQSHQQRGGFTTEPEYESEGNARPPEKPPFRTTGSSVNGTRGNGMENRDSRLSRGLSGMGNDEGRYSRAVSGTGAGDGSRSRPLSVLGRGDKGRSRSSLDWIVPELKVDKKMFKEEATAGQRLLPTLEVARRERDKCSLRARWTGIVLNIAIGMQVLLGALTTGIAAALSGRQVSIAISILGGATTLVASYIAKSRGSGEPELSITRKKDLDQFIRECETFQMDHGHNVGTIKDFELNQFRDRFEELLGNGSGERKLAKPL